MESTKQPLKVDRTKLKSMKTYAKMRGMTVQRVYQLVNEKKLNVVEIDGSKFIYLQ
jgi:hypothetical protein